MFKTYDSGETWEEKAKLLASDRAGGDEFGYSVSVHGDTIVVGAWYNDNSAGTNAGEGLGTVLMYILCLLICVALYSVVTVLYGVVLFYMLLYWTVFYCILPYCFLFVDYDRICSIL